MKGVILERGFRFYTNMRTLLEPIKDDFQRYNWLVTDCECNRYPDPRIQHNAEYSWISGSDFLEIVNKHDIYFIWAVFSAIPKTLSIEDVLQFEFPYADGYPGFWQNPIGIQHPLAEMEIVPWDSSLVLLISKDEATISHFQAQFPLCEDLEQYNCVP